MTFLYEVTHTSTITMQVTIKKYLKITKTCRRNDRGAPSLEITSGAVRVCSVSSQLYFVDLKWAGGGGGCVTQLPSLYNLNHRNCDNVRQIHATSPGSGVGAYIRRLG